MANNIIKRVWNQNKMVNIEDLSGFAFQAEDGGHTFEISGIDADGNTVALSGTVAGVFRRPDNADIALTGAASDGVASVTLTDDCYAVPGRAGLTIFVTSGGQKVAVYAAALTVTRTSGGAVAGDTPQDVVDLINAIEAAVATIPSSYTDLMASIAPTYSSSALYPVGAYAWYDGVLYRCTTPITTAESWTAAHWTTAVFGADLGEINAAIKMSDTELSYTYAEGTLIRYANGNTSSSSQSNATNYVDIGGYDKIRYARVKTTQTSAPAAGMAFYDESKTYISGLVSAYNQDANGYDDYELAVPANAKYARFTFYQDTTLGTFYVYGVSNINTEVSNIEEKVDDLWASVFPKTLFNLYLLGTESGYLHSGDGHLVASNDYTTTLFIDVTRFSKLFLNNGTRYWFYDSSKAALSTGNLNNVTPSAGTLKELSVPSGASYFRINIYNDNLTGAEYIYGDAFISDLIDAKNKKEPLTYYAIGDSITRGMYAEYGASSSSGPTDQNYPYWLGVENGYTVVNLGESGGGYASKGTQSNSNCKDIVDANAFTGADIITIAFGVNDWKNATQDVILGSMSSTAGDGTVIGNMKYSIEKLYEKAPKAQLIVMLPFNTNRVFTGMDANAMTLENNWAFGYAYRHNQTLEDYRAAIRTCAEYYNVRVIDLEEVLPINRLNIRYVCGDGLHPTKAFYKQMGHALAPFVR